MPTMVVGSAFEIMSAAWPPRSTFVNYPLGHTVGKPNDPDDQLRIVRAALTGFEQLSTPGQVNVLACDWGATVDYCDVVGKAHAGPIKESRDRVIRYQSEADKQAALAHHGSAAEGVASPEAQRQATALVEMGV